MSGVHVLVKQMLLAFLSLELFTPSAMLSSLLFFCSAKHGPEKFLREIKKIEILKGTDLFPATFFERKQVNSFFQMVNNYQNFAKVICQGKKGKRLLSKT